MGDPAVIDEAYHPFGDQRCFRRSAATDNLKCDPSFSKAWACRFEARVNGGTSGGNHGTSPRHSFDINAFAGCGRRVSLRHPQHATDCSDCWAWRRARAWRRIATALRLPMRWQFSARESALVTIQKTSALRAGLPRCAISVPLTSVDRYEAMCASPTGPSEVLGRFRHVRPRLERATRTPKSAAEKRILRCAD